jgi:hypothetical protein
MTTAAEPLLPLKTFIDVDAFVREINEDISDLNEAMRTQTARAAHYSMQSTRAKKQKDLVANTVRVIDAALTKKMRVDLTVAANDLAEKDGTKPERITADMVKAEVCLHVEARKWAAIQIDADEIAAVCRAAYDAFYSRREMLTSLGRLTQEQMRTNLTIQTAQQHAEGYKSRRAVRRGEVPASE